MILRTIFQTPVLGYHGEVRVAAIVESVDAGYAVQVGFGMGVVDECSGVDGVGCPVR